MSFFKPKTNIFKRFEALNNVLLEVGKELLLVPDSFPHEIEQRATRMRKLENSADDITHAIIDEINVTFVTPIDSEDLHRLAVRLDDVIDHAENAVSNLVVYGIRKPRYPLAEFCITINKAIIELAACVNLLKTPQKDDGTSRHHVEINTLESTGDELLKNGLRDLFEHENDVKEIIKWKDIFQSFEDSLDRAEDAADVIEGIVIKNR
ncbi:MAG: DUF47 family protein [Sideroxyarcus sp.]|nr:DUF47 family protein [Sideroxyarcus sp.]